MAQPKSWQFPRWGKYGKGSDPATVRLCDYHGCGKPGDRPAPKARNSNDKWWFCIYHAAEYNRGWNFFTGMSKEEADRARSDEETAARGYRQRDNIWEWGIDEENAAERQRRAALRVLELEDHASRDEIKRRFRALAKKFHPDRNEGDAESAEHFKSICAAHRSLMEA